MERTVTLPTSAVGCLVVAVDVPLDGDFILFAGNRLSIFNSEQGQTVASNT